MSDFTTHDHVFYEVYWPTLDACSFGVQHGAGVQSEFFRTEHEAVELAVSKAQVIAADCWVAVRKLRIHLGEIHPLMRVDDFLFLLPGQNPGEGQLVVQ